VRASRCGLTVAEALVAVVMVTVGLLALVGSSARATRMIGVGRHATVASAVAAGRLDRLRVAAFATSPPCTGPEFAAGSAVQRGITEGWRIVDVGGATRRIELVVRHGTSGGLATDTVVTAVSCLQP
jgi:Tfp pilus assembly protein PilV